MLKKLTIYLIILLTNVLSGDVNATELNGFELRTTSPAEQPKEKTAKEDTKSKSQDKPQIKEELPIKKIDTELSIPKYYAGKKTLMYKEENINQIVQILTSITQGINYDKITGDDIRRAQTTTTQILEDTVVSVYLNSILYISEDLWSVWANGKKISNMNNGEGELEVLKIWPNKVKFLWTIGLTKWEIINANKTISEEVYEVKDNKILMTFTLEPNQSFVPATNSIVEGDVQKELAKKKAKEEAEKEALKQTTGGALQDFLEQTRQEEAETNK